MKESEGTAGGSTCRPGGGAGWRGRPAVALGLNSRNAGLCILPRDLPGHLGATAAGTATSSRRPVLPASHPNRGEGKRGPEVLGTGPAGHGGGAAGSTAPVLSLQPELESTAVPPEGQAPKPNTDGTAGVTAWPLPWEVTKPCPSGWGDGGKCTPTSKAPLAVGISGKSPSYTLLWA